MRMSRVFPLPIEIDNYKGVALSPERNKAIEHAVNYHDKLVEVLRLVVADVAPSDAVAASVVFSASLLLDEIDAHD